MNHIWPNVGKAKMGLRGSSFLALDCLTKVPWFIETDHQKMELAHKLAINKKICNFCLILPFWPSQWWVKLPKFLWIWTKIVDFLSMLHFRASFIFHWSVFTSIGTKKSLLLQKTKQFPKISIVPLVNKPYVNEVTLPGQNPPIKYC